MEIGDGYRAKNSELGNSGFPFARAANINDGFKFEGADCFPADRVATVGGKISRIGDVVFTSKGTVGRFAFVSDEAPRFVYSPQLCYWRSLDHKQLNPRYLYFWMQSQEFLHQIGYLKGQTDMADYVSLRDQRKMSLTVPDPVTQEYVAQVLGGLESRIELLRQTNTTLDAIANAVFKSWFVDFEPVRAKAEGREPEGMEAATAALFPSEFEGSQLGPIPKNWRVTNVGAIAQLIKGCSYKGAFLRESEGAYMFNLGCFNARRIFATEKIKRYTGAYRDKQAVSEGDLIVANTDMTPHREILGRPLLVPAGCEPGFISHHAFKVAIRSGNKDEWKRVLFFAFQQPAFRQRAVGYATGTTVLALARDSAEKCPIVDPGEGVLTAFNGVVAPFLAQIANNLQRANSIESLRDTLLPRLVSGNLRLPEAVAEVVETRESGEVV
ncbi:MAG: hypothetical protein ABIP11_09975 [Luteimonas sp.]